jgi:Arc/MetJ-type ribon-helix-helix transcriptional regulator
MSRQIAIRLPEELVDFVDSQVEEGRAKSRAAVVTKALARERRREAAQRDADILSRGEDDEDLTALARYLAHRPTNLD